ncbi:MAG: hypothetical protein JO314_08920 [Acidobacteria bacterium]|nr:hypothetical protein [Acidobacteriota bacterium]
MVKRYRFWFIAAVLFQFVTGIIHTLSLFIPLRGDSDAENQMISLVTTYKLDLGAGFHPTFFNLFTALSSCMSFLLFFAALTNGYLLWKHTPTNVMRGIVSINLVIFGVLLIVVSYFTFLAPIIFVGIVVVNLLAAFITIPRGEISE